MTPLKARAGGSGGRQRRNARESDADRLIASFRLRADAEARRRQRQPGVLRGRGPLGPGREPHRAACGRTARRRIADADRVGRRRRPWRRGLGRRPPVRFFEVDPLDELERILAARPQRFRLSVLCASAPITARPFSPKPKFKPPTPPARSAKPSQQTGRRERSACACSISRGGRSSSGSRPICDRSRTRGGAGVVAVRSVSQR